MPRKSLVYSEAPPFNWSSLEWLSQKVAECHVSNAPAPEYETMTDSRRMLNSIWSAPT